MLIILVLAGCGKSEAAQGVDDQIAALGEITLSKGTAIQEAEDAVENLDSKDQRALENVEMLREARSKYEALRQEQVDEVERTIHALGTITLEKADMVAQARNTYQSLEAELRERVSNVENLISSIGEVTLESEEAIKTARAAIMALSEEKAKRVEGADVLAAAENSWKELKEAADKKAIAALVQRMRVTEDKVQGVTWYESVHEPYYADTRSFVSVYIGKNSGSAWLRMRFHYTEDDWIFWTKLTVMVDGTKYYRTYNYWSDLVRDNAYGNVWEYVDRNPSEDDLEMIRAIADSKETIIRFQGDNYYYDYTVRAEDKQGIKDVLELYELLK